MFQIILKKNYEKCKNNRIRHTDSWKRILRTEILYLGIILSFTAWFLKPVESKVTENLFHIYKD